MTRSTSWQLGLLIALLWGCRSTDPAQVNAGGQRAAPSASHAAAAPSGSGTGASRGTSSPSATPSAQPVALPKLKPVLTKPFPEGADEATVCEAIDSAEPDLWVRFGHMVPAYVAGAIYILETGPESQDKLYDYISRKYVYGYHSQQASCRGNLTLLYIRLMFDKSEYQGKPFGREHLSDAIERKFGIKTRASFQLQNDHERLSNYCRQDADLCEALVKVDRGNDGQGLCALAVAMCEMKGHGGSAARLLELCSGVAPSVLACLEYARGGAALRVCRERVAAAVCP